MHALHFFHSVWNTYDTLKCLCSWPNGILALLTLGIRAIGETITEIGSALFCMVSDPTISFITQVY